jgi:SAM-dependent methyltransferase
VTAAAQPFDAAAVRYDAAFTDRVLGRWLRSAVRERLAAAFAPEDHVLELGCGTGEDAVWLAGRGVRVTATDSSGAMLAVAEAKAAQAAVADRVSFARLELSAPRIEGRFDGAFSNFGALNCVEDRRPLAEALGACVRPGGRLVLVVMGPVCAWEIAWHLGQGRPRTAFRRLRAGATAHTGGGARVRVWYPSPGRLRRELEPWFRRRETAALGVLLPPSYLADLVDRRPVLFDRLRRLERRLPLPWLADHYVAVFERR